MLRYFRSMLIAPLCVAFALTQIPIADAQENVDIESIEARLKQAQAAEASKEEAKRRAERQAETQLRAEREAQKSRSAAIELDMVGKWSFDFTDNKGTAYSGSVLVDQKLGPGVFKGTVDATNPANHQRVRQAAFISVEGKNITITCSNPVVVSGSGTYSADTFLLTEVNDRLLKGYYKDVNSSGGFVVLTR